jgi:DNA-binding transcriptional LysR family regulator
VPELRHLRAFLAVADELSFTAAAERLFMTQQQLSRQVAQLESELGVRLFERSTRRVRLTGAGERMLDHARLAVRNADASFADARSDRSRPLRVDLSSSGLQTGAMILERLRGSAPEIAVTQVEHGVGRGLVALRRGELDVLLGRAASAPADVASRLVRHEPILIGMSRDHPLARGESISIRDLEDQPLLLPSDEAAGEWNVAVGELCRDAGFLPRRHPGSTHGSVGAAEVLRGGRVVTPTVPWRAPPPDLIFLPLAPRATYPMSAMWVAEDPSPQVQTFLEVAGALGRDLGWLDGAPV